MGSAPVTYCCSGVEDRISTGYLRVPGDVRPQMGPSCCQGAATDSAFGGWRVRVGRGPGEGHSQGGAGGQGCRTPGGPGIALHVKALYGWQRPGQCSCYMGAVGTESVSFYLIHIFVFSRCKMYIL